MHIEYNECRLCARNCGVNRNSGRVGYCRADYQMKICRAALHLWEEPIISGENGSGTVFFSGCSMRCIFCQNSDISRASVGRTVTDDELAEIMLELQKKGANNINFVTPTHFAPSIKAATEKARDLGLDIPTVYNTGSFDRVETVKALDGVIDIYLPDFKYYKEATSLKYSSAENYPSVALDCIKEMVRQRPRPIIESGIMKSGVIIRLLLLPGHVAEAKLSLKKLYREFGESVYYSLMGQYTPTEALPAPLNRRVTLSEYREFVDYAAALGVTNAFVQELSSANTAYIPKFDTN